MSLDLDKIEFELSELNNLKGLIGLVISMNLLRK